MKEYTIDDLKSDYEAHRDKIWDGYRETMLLGNGCSASSNFDKIDYLLYKVIELTNRVQELENKAVSLPSLTKEQLNKIEHDYKINGYRNIEL